MSADDYFSRAARMFRRAARMNDLNKVAEATKGERKSHLTTQNAGVQAVKLVREVFDNYRLPTNPKLSYSGVRGLRIASNSSNVEDGVVTVHAEFKTRTGVNVGIDIPVEIHRGEFLEPSVILVDGAPRVIAQSTFDNLVARNTLYEEPPTRSLYSPPMNKQENKLAQENRIKVERVNTGMFSVQAARDSIRKAIQGLHVEADYDADGNWIKPWEQKKTETAAPPDEHVADSDEEASLEKQADDVTKPGITPAPLQLQAPGADKEWQPGQQLSSDTRFNPAFAYPDVTNPTNNPHIQKVRDNLRYREPAPQPDVGSQESLRQKQMNDPANQYKGPVTTGIPTIKKNPAWPGYGNTPPANQDVTRSMPRRPDEGTQRIEPTKLGLPPHMGPDNTSPAKPWPQAASVEDYDAEDRHEKPDHDRNHQDGDWNDPAERKDQHDLWSGMEVSLKETLEVKERGGVVHDKSKGTKCKILRDHAGDNKSFVVEFEDGMQAIVERHFLKSAAKPKKEKPLFKVKKQPKMCAKCNKAPCVCHRKKSEKLNFP